MNSYCARESDVVAAVAVSCHKQLAQMGCPMRAQLILDLQARRIRQLSFCSQHLLHLLEREIHINAHLLYALYDRSRQCRVV